MYREDDLLSISGLQHFLYCKRQCALIHLERLWEDNFFTAKGIVMHTGAHSEERSVKKGITTERGLFIKSYKLGLIGKTDIVEFQNKNSKTKVFPVEYKSGSPKNDNTDKVQLCAQAICLEEMLDVSILEGAIYYGKIRKRENVVFDSDLRTETANIANDFHELIKAKKTPTAEYSKKCDNCSFKELCMPALFSNAMSVRKYIEKMVKNEKTS